jgi:hypothetical protein
MHHLTTLPLSGLSLSRGAPGRPIRQSGLGNRRRTIAVMRTLHRCAAAARSRDQAFRRAAGSVVQHGGSAESDVIRDLAWLCPILVDAPRGTIEAAQIDVTAGRGPCREVGLANPWFAAWSIPIRETN